MDHANRLRVDLIELDGFLSAGTSSVPDLADHCANRALRDLVRTKEHIAGDILGMGDRAGQQAIDPACRSHIQEPTRPAANGIGIPRLGQRSAGRTGVQSRVAVSNSKRAFNAASFVKNRLKHGTAFCGCRAGLGENTKRSGNVSLTTAGGLKQSTFKR